MSNSHDSIHHAQNPERFTLADETEVAPHVSARNSSDYGDLEREIGLDDDSEQCVELLPSSPGGNKDLDDSHVRKSNTRRYSRSSLISRKYSDFRKTPIKIRLYNLWCSVVYSYAGVKLLLLSQFFNAGMAATTRLLETTSDPPYHPLQILFVRMTITYIGCFAFMYFKKIPDFILGPPGIRLLLVLRGTVGFFGVYGLYYSVNYLELSDATVITFLTPTMAAVLAWFFLGESLIFAEVAGGFVALLGVVLIARPSFIMEWFDANHSRTGGDTDNVPEYLRLRAIFFALLGVFGAGMAFVSIRWIGKRAHPLVSVSYFAAWCVLVSTLGLIAIPGLSFVLPQNLYQWMLLFALGVCGFLMQFSLTAGIQRVKAGRAAAATYTQILWAVMWERLIWHKSPDLLSLLGGGLIIGSAITVSLIKYKQNAPDTKDIQDARNEGIVILDHAEDDNAEIHNRSSLDRSDNFSIDSRESTELVQSSRLLAGHKGNLEPFDNGIIDGGPLLETQQNRGHIPQSAAISPNISRGDLKGPQST